jgi:ubiquinone/menaquinone biosynthesis C-methylase UbiE
MGDHERLDREIAAHYTEVPERQRLGPLSLERLRTWELLVRHLPAAPAVVLDVGGAAGVYALPLAARGYQVHLVDPMARHVEQAQEASGRQPETPLASATVGDARRLQWSDAGVDAVLLLGPLYHLTDRADRIRALGEARRVLRPGGVLVAAAISRFASMMDGLLRGSLDDPAFGAIVDRDLRDGQHRTRPGARSGSPPPTSTGPTSWPGRSPRPGWSCRTWWPSRGRPGWSPTSGSAWPTPPAASGSSGPSAAWRPSRACSGRAPTCSPSLTPDRGASRHALDDADRLDARAAR